MPRHLSIVVISRSFVPNMGGGEIQLHSLAKQLTELGHNISVITSTRGGRRASYHEKYRLVELPSTGVLALDMLLHVTFLLPCLLALAAVVEVDVIQVNSLVSLFPSSLVGKILRKPTIVHLWGDQQLGLVSRNARVINLLVDRVIVLNQNARGRLAASGFPSSKIRLIPNGVDIPPAGIRPSQREVDVAWIGRLDPIKRPQLYSLASPEQTAVVGICAS